MPRQFVQQRMTLSDLEWPFHASRVIAAADELLDCFVDNFSAFYSLVKLTNKHDDER